MRRGTQCRHLVVALTVTWQVVAVPKLEHAPPHPANVDELVALSVKVSMVPDVSSPEQVPETTPLVSEQSIPSLSETLPVPVPVSAMVSVKDCAMALTVSVVLESLALVKLESPA